jgi:hypothetical protein
MYTRQVLAPINSFFGGLDGPFGGSSNPFSAFGGGDSSPFPSLRTVHVGFPPISIRRISLPSFLGFNNGGVENDHQTSGPRPPMPGMSEPFRALEDTLPEFPSGGPDDGAFGGMKEMFDRMHSKMKEMMQGMMSKTQTLDNGSEMPAETPRGHMVVIKSGPGYREQKTYDFGPDGIKTRTETNGNVMGGGGGGDMRKFLQF